MLIQKIMTLPLNIRKLICCYDKTLEKYIHIKYTCIHLKEQLYTYKPCIITILELMKTIDFFYKKTSFEKYTPKQISHLLLFYKSFEPWGSQVVEFYPWSIDVAIALIADGYYPSTRKNLPTVWKFQISLREKFSKIQYVERYVHI